MSPRRRALAAMVVGLATLAVAVVIALAHSEPRLAESNNVRDPVFAAVLRGDQTLCQMGELVPKDAATARILVGTYGRPLPPLTFTVRNADDPPITARVRGGGREGYIPIPLPATKSSRPGSKICLTNGGKSKIAIGGETIPPAARIGKRDAGGRIRVAYYRPGKESWFHLAPTVAHRFGYGNAPWMGPWTLWLVALLFLGSAGAAVVAVLRSEER